MAKVRREAHLLHIGQVILVEGKQPHKLKALCNNVEWFVECLGHYCQLVGTNLHYHTCGEKNASKNKIRCMDVRSSCHSVSLIPMQASGDETATVLHYTANITYPIFHDRHHNYQSHSES